MSFDSESALLEDNGGYLATVCGDMSVVGPRPERPEIVALLGDAIPGCDDRHRLRPGMTGWASS